MELLITIIMKKKVPIILLLLATLLSCHKEGGECGGVRVSFTLDSFSLSRSSCLTGEDEITAVQLFVTDADGDIVDDVFSGGGFPVSFKGRVGETYRLYAFANHPSEITGLSSEADILGWEYSANLSEHFPCGLPMAGVKEWTVTGRDAEVSIELTRLVAKLLLTLDKSLMSLHGNFTADSVRLRNCPSRIRPFAEGQKISDAADAGDGDVAGEEDLAVFNSGGSVCFYVLENMQGDLLPGNGDPWAKTPENLSSKADLCTYLEVEGSYSSPGYSGRDSYRMYLGSDNSSNFDLRRNSLYRLTFIPSEDNMRKEGNWKITASDWTDTRSMYFTSSLLIVMPGKEMSLELKFSPADFGYVLSDSGLSDVGLSYSAIGNTVTLSCAEDAQIGKSGLLTATSWDGRVETSCTVRVGSGRTTLSELSVTPAEVTLAVGETAQLKAMYRVSYYEDGVPVNVIDFDVTSDKEVEWSVGKRGDQCFSISPTGLVTALSAGTGYAFCTYGGAGSSSTIKVK